MSNNYSQEDSQHVPECRHKNRCWHPQCHRSHTRGNLRDVCNLVKLGLECEREVCYFNHDPANEVSSDDEEEKVPHRDCNYGNRCDYGPGCTFAHYALDPSVTCGQYARRNRCTRLHCEYDHTAPQRHAPLQLDPCPNGTDCQRHKCNRAHPKAEGNRRCRREYTWGRCDRGQCESKHLKKR